MEHMKRALLSYMCLNWVINRHQIKGNHKYSNTQTQNNINNNHNNKWVEVKAARTFVAE